MQHQCTVRQRPARRRQLPTHLNDYVVNLVDTTLDKKVEKPLHGWSYDEWKNGLDDDDDDDMDFITPDQLVTSSRNSTADSSHLSTASATSDFSWHTSSPQDQHGDDDSDDLIDFHSDIQDPVVVIDDMIAAQIHQIDLNSHLLDKVNLRRRVVSIGRQIYQLENSLAHVDCATKDTHYDEHNDDSPSDQSNHDESPNDDLNNERHSVSATDNSDDYNQNIPDTDEEHGVPDTADNYTIQSHLSDADDELEDSNSDDTDSLAVDALHNDPTACADDSSAPLMRYNDRHERRRPPSRWRGDSPRPGTSSAAAATEKLSRRRLDLQRLFQSSSRRRRQSSSWDNYADTETRGRHDSNVDGFRFELGTLGDDLVDEGDVFEEYHDDDVNQQLVFEDVEDHERLPRQRLAGRSLPGRTIEQRDRALPRRSQRLQEVPRMCYKSLHLTGSRTLINRPVIDEEEVAIDYHDEEHMEDEEGTGENREKDPPGGEGSGPRN